MKPPEGVSPLPVSASRVLDATGWGRGWPLVALLRSFSWQELRHHPWRSAAAAVAVMLGVALAFSVHLINASALSEFSSAVRAISGQPDLSLRAVSTGFDERLYGELARHPGVAAISPVVEISTYALGDQGTRHPLRVLGVDALQLQAMAPELIPVPEAAADGDAADGARRLDIFAPDSVFLNANARALISREVPAFMASGGRNVAAQGTDARRERLYLQSGLRVHELRVAGHVASGGPALAVMDIAAAQELFGRIGKLSRIDVVLQSGTTRADFLRDVGSIAGFSGQLDVNEPGDMDQRIGALSRAYRVNLTVLALVALFTGAFLVFSVLALSVARRTQQFALLGVLGLSPRQRLNLVLAEAGAIGAVGSLAGLLLGTGLAALALRLLGGDLGGGYFTTESPPLQWHWGAAVLYGVLGVLAALAGGWWPARQAQGLPPAQALKGLGASQAPMPRRGRASLLLLGAGVVLAFVPPVAGMPLAAYLSVALLLLGGITGLPLLIALLYGRLAQVFGRWLLPLLAIERARRQRETAAVAIGGVVASLSLAVALTVMVASFRQSVTDWLGHVLPADLYVRTAQSLSATETAFLEAGLVHGIGQVPGVKAMATVRVMALQLVATRPPVTLIARPLHPDGSTPQAPNPALPLVGSALPLPADAGDAVPAYLSEAMADLYHLKPGQFFRPDSLSRQDGKGFDAPVLRANYFVAGIWRDYARQHGTLAIDAADFVRLSGDHRVNDLALWLHPGADLASVQSRIRQLADEFHRAAGMGERNGASGLLEFATTAQLRDTSLRIFDRSFAVTYWLQAVAIGIGLFGVAASFSAQVLARRKEFGLLAHLGLTRNEVLRLVAAEGLVWSLLGALAGLALGLVVALVLVHVVNPQSFHWTMDLHIPWLRLDLLCLAVLVSGTVTAWAAARSAAARDVVMAVKEDW